jgi:hypothetical protein
VAAELKKWLAETLPISTRLQHYVTQKDVRIEGDEARVAAYFYNPMAIDNADDGSWDADGDVAFTVVVP